MAKGDLTPKEWLQKTLDNTAANSTIAGAENVRRYITAIGVKLQGGAATKRTVTVFKNGTAAGNEVWTFELDPAGVKADLITQLPWFLDIGQSIYFKQDVGADVNIIVTGTEEALV